MRGDGGGGGGGFETLMLIDQEICSHLNTIAKTLRSENEDDDDEEEEEMNELWYPRRRRFGKSFSRRL